MPLDVVCPNKGEMSDCKKKPKCKWGECEGQALPSDPDDYCDAGYEFREEYCDCQSQYTRAFLVTWTERTVNFANCGGSCVTTDEVLTYQKVLRMPGSTLKFAPVGELHLQSISDSCPNGPVNCGRTPESYGITFQMAWPGTGGYPGVLGSTGNVLPLNYNYAGNPGVYTFFCGEVDDLYVTFALEDHPDQIIAVLVGGSWTGAVGCVANVTTLVDIEPYFD